MKFRKKAPGMKQCCIFHAQELVETTSSSGTLFKEEKARTMYLNTYSSNSSKFIAEINPKILPNLPSVSNRTGILSRFPLTSTLNQILYKAAFSCSRSVDGQGQRSFDTALSLPLTGILFRCHFGG